MKSQCVNLCAELGPQAISLCDAFAITDTMLSAPIALDWVQVSHPSGARTVRITTVSITAVRKMALSIITVNKTTYALMVVGLMQLRGQLAQ